MLKLQRGTTLSTDQEDMEGLAFDHFMHILGATADRGCTVNLLALDLTREDLRELEEVVTEEEVW